MRNPAAVLLFASLFTSLASRDTHAAWPVTSTTNLPVSTAELGQTNPVMVPDGAGGVLIAWSDQRDGGSIYAQHVLQSGVVDPLWPVNGRSLCTAAGSRNQVQLASDGQGGAYATWFDQRADGGDVYAQRVLANGSLASGWPAGGLAVCTASGTQFTPRITAEGAAGAIVCWVDARSITTNELYGQRVLPAGAVDPAWPANGRLMGGNIASSLELRITSDGLGGAVAVGTRLNSGTVQAVAYHVSSAGILDPLWGSSGVQLSNGSGDSRSPDLAPDGAGGFVFAWQQIRGTTGNDIMSARLSLAGTLRAGFATGGNVLCADAGAQNNPRVAPDGQGGMIVCWEDSRSGFPNVYAQHCLVTGQLDPAWPASGLQPGTGVFNQIAPVIRSDNAGGAFLAWQDVRNSPDYDIVVTRVHGDGTVDPSWGPPALPVCTAAGIQAKPQLVEDGASGVILCWSDFRNGTNLDVYAQRVSHFGFLGAPEPVIVSVLDTPADQGGFVRVLWTASYLESPPISMPCTYRGFRSVPATTASARLAEGEVTYSLTDNGNVPGGLYVQQIGAQTFYWEQIFTAFGDGSASYQLTVPTTSDSLPGSNPLSFFLVQARNGARFWDSLPVGGYSVDNLAPEPPSSFAGLWTVGFVSLHWGQSPSADRLYYRLYRDLFPTFVPSPATLVASTADTLWSALSQPPGWYKVTTVDLHGNESPPLSLLPTGTVAVEPLAPVLSFAPPAPSPATTRTQLRFSLPEAARVTLGVYDVSGRHVRQLVHGALAAGGHAFSWDLRDDAGRPVPAGLYFARLETPARLLTRTALVVR